MRKINKLLISNPIHWNSFGILRDSSQFTIHLTPTLRINLPPSYLFLFLPVSLSHFNFRQFAFNKTRYQRACKVTERPSRITKQRAAAPEKERKAVSNPRTRQHRNTDNAAGLYLPYTLSIWPRALAQWYIYIARDLLYTYIALLGFGAGDAYLRERDDRTRASVYIYIHVRLHGWTIKRESRKRVREKRVFLFLRLAARADERWKFVGRPYCEQWGWNRRNISSHRIQN